QSQLHFKPAEAFDEALQRLALDKFHRIEVIRAASAQIVNRSHIGMPDAGRCACLAQKPKASRFVAEISFTDNLQSNRALQVDIERFVGNAHSAATQLDWFPVLRRQQFVMPKARDKALWRSLKRVLGGRLA